MAQSGEIWFKISAQPACEGEIATREVLQSFAEPDIVAPDLSDLSLYALEPYHHVKVFRVQGGPDIRARVEFPESLSVVFHSLSEQHGAAVYITREISRSRWSTDERFSNVQQDLFIFFFDQESELLFICASRRVEGLYEALAASISGGRAKALPLARVNGALNELTQTEFFNVGMRNRVASNTTESYRIVVGSSAHQVIQKSDARLYHRGHLFGRQLTRKESASLSVSAARPRYGATLRRGSLNSSSGASRSQGGSRATKRRSRTRDWIIYPPVRRWRSSRKNPKCRLTRRAVPQPTQPDVPDSSGHGAGLGTRRRHHDRS